MAMSTQITAETSPTTDWFAEPLAALLDLFAAQLSDDSEPTSESDPTVLPPPTNERPEWAPPASGETVDTSQADPQRFPVSSTGVAWSAG
ncbi:hypothetical protein [Saccharopolyspora hordei]|mgnify:CR=1 FL=1|uniref:Uncharacterized protein n=1 Tax=Saccharopolyspora hordei TaxID=1838 RepID=A0A853APC8_9PSEU|nr:hypothetical protein [Saccharopolyspora hordei]NYI82057.1 hypothetical protein [Saccharopolyspora hordei]